VHKNNLYPLPDGIDARMCAPLGCGMQTGAGAILNYLKPQAGYSVLVTGAGVVGLCAVMAARLTGAARIICADRVASRLDLALALGATDIIDTSAIPEYDNHCKIITGGRGPDYSIDCTGNGECVRRSLVAVRSLGVCVVLGTTHEIILHSDDGLGRDGKSLIGIVEGCSYPQKFIPELLEYHKQGQFPFDKLISYYPFEDINKAESDMQSGSVLKPVIVF